MSLISNFLKNILVIKNEYKQCKYTHFQRALGVFYVNLYKENKMSSWFKCKISFQMTCSFFNELQLDALKREWNSWQKSPSSLIELCPCCLQESMMSPEYYYPSFTQHQNPITIVKCKSDRLFVARHKTCFHSDLVITLEYSSPLSILTYHGINIFSGISMKIEVKLARWNIWCLHVKIIFR